MIGKVFVFFLSYTPLDVQFVVTIEGMKSGARRFALAVLFGKEGATIRFRQEAIQL
jgi:hypothetical protein